MTSEQERPAEPEPEEAPPPALPDLEYDLAHEEHGRAPGAEEPAAESVYVATQTTEYDGDYEYDMAHDVPGR